MKDEYDCTLHRRAYTNCGLNQPDRQGYDSLTFRMYLETMAHTSAQDRNYLGPSTVPTSSLDVLFGKIDSISRI